MAAFIPSVFLPAALGGAFKSPTQRNCPYSTTDTADAISFSQYSFAFFLLLSLVTLIFSI